MRSRVLKFGKFAAWPRGQKEKLIFSGNVQEGFRNLHKMEPSADSEGNVKKALKIFQRALQQSLLSQTLSSMTEECFPGSVPWSRGCIHPQDTAACIPAAPAPAMAERCTGTAWFTASGVQAPSLGGFHIVLSQKVHRAQD